MRVSRGTHFGGDDHRKTLGSLTEIFAKISNSRPNTWRQQKPEAILFFFFVLS